MAHWTSEDSVQIALFLSDSKKKNMEETPHVTTTQGKRITVAKSRFKTDICENDNVTVYLFGHARRYGTAECIDANWLAQQNTDEANALYAQLAGNFACVWVNTESGRVFALNDHLASVPLYFAQTSEQLVLSTDMAGIAKHTDALSLSPQSIYHYCYFHCIPSPQTIYQEVSKLPPGHGLTVIEQMSEMTNLYVPHFSNGKIDTDKKLKECFDEVQWGVDLYQEENTGAFLSGGIDSSTVSGMLAKLRGQARTFSVGFKEPGYDETEFAEITAKHFGTSHDAAYLPPEYITDNFRKVASEFDEPFGNSSALAAFFCASHAKSKGIDVLLAGDGGDELFAGNSRYAKQKLFFPYEKSPKLFKGLLKGIFLQTPLGKLPVLKKVASYINQAENPLPDRLQAYNFLHRFSPNEIFTEAFLAQVDTHLPIEQLRERYKQADSESEIDKMLYLDWKFTLADNDLIKVSRMCQAAGVDVKFPLIEKELVDFSCTVPASVKLPGQKLRDFFKKAMQSFLAPETLSKSKHGFGLPFGRWMRTTPALIELTQQSLNQLKKRNIIQESFIDKALDMQNNQHSAYYGELIWILTVLELWLASREQ